MLTRSFEIVVGTRAGLDCICSARAIRSSMLFVRRHSGLRLRFELRFERHAVLHLKGHHPRRIEQMRAISAVSR